MQAIEIIPIPDTFISGVSQMEDLGNGLLRIYYYVKQGADNVIVAKHIIAASCLPAVREIANEAVARAAPEILSLLPGAMPPLLS
jgi:hypothetical protein